jgi:hypothetical protein
MAVLPGAPVSLFIGHSLADERNGNVESVAWRTPSDMAQTTLQAAF